MELSNGSCEYVRLILVCNATIKKLHERLLGQPIAQEQLMDMRPPHAESDMGVLYRLNSARGTRH